MALTAAEQAELAQLEQEVGGSLSASEAAELAQLEAELGTGQPEKIVNEMPEGLTGRFVYKNFGADPVAAFNYLQKVNPDFELKTDKSGEVLARKRGTQDWGRLDPKGFDWRDLTDIAYDVPAAVAQGAATAAAGLAGAPAGGVGAIPAAMAGSAVSGMGLETLRQGIGSYFIDDNMSGKDIGIAGAAGAVSPLLFGTGAGVNQAAKAALKSGSTKTAQEILSTQRGLLGRGYDATAGYLGPKLANLAGGENVKVIKKAADILPEIKLADKNTEITSQPLKQAAQDVSKGIKQAAQKTGNILTELRNTIDNQPGLVVKGQKTGSIDAKPFVQPFRELVDDLEKTASSDADREAIAELKKIIQKQFTGMDEFMTAAQVDAKIKAFKNIAKQYGIDYGKTGSTQSSSIAGVAGRVGDAFESSRKIMNESIINRLEQMNPELAEKYVGAKDSYGKLMNIAAEQKNNFKNATNVKNFLNRAMTDPSDIAANQLEEIQKITGVDLEDLATRTQALKVFSKPDTEIRSIGRSVTPRQLALGAAGAAAGGLIGSNMGQQDGGQTYMPTMIGALLGGTLGSKAAAPAMIRKYMEANKALRQTIPTQGIPMGPTWLQNATQRVLNSTPYLMMNTNLNDQGAK